MTKSTTPDTEIEAFFKYQEHLCNELSNLKKFPSTIGFLKKQNEKVVNDFFFNNLFMLYQSTFNLNVNQKSREDIIYQIKVTYDGIHTEFTLKSSAPKTSVKKYNYSGKVQTSVRTQSNLNEFKEFITSGKYEETVYKSSTFISPTSNSFRASFGDTINNTSSKSDQFTSAGMAFVCYLNTACGDASDIEACLAGRVVAVGETKYGGNTVVVDHGLGLRSVYYCLKNVEVVVGTIVNPGDKIANGCAKKGYTDGETCYIEFWVGETPVSYKDLQINGFGMNFGEEPEI